MPKEYVLTPVLSFCLAKREEPFSDFQRKEKRRMVSCHVSADLFGAAGRYRLRLIPLPLHRSGSGRLPRSGARLWGMNVRRAVERRSTHRRISQGSASGRRHARYRHGERRPGRTTPLTSAPSGSTGRGPWRRFGDFAAVGKVTRARGAKLSHVSHSARRRKLLPIGFQGPQPLAALW